MTIVTYQRDCLFGEIENEIMVLDDFGKIADECWLTIPEHFPNVELGAHVIMPNHVHGVIVIRDDESMPHFGMIDDDGTMTISIPIKSTPNLVHWARLSIRINPPFRIESTRNTTRQASGSAIIMNTSSATNGRWTTSGGTSNLIPRNGMAIKKICPWRNEQTPANIKHKVPESRKTLRDFY